MRRLSMIKISEILRLRFELQLSYRKIGRSQNVSLSTVGVNQQTASKFHGILLNRLYRKPRRRFSTSQNQPIFIGIFLGTPNPIESIIFSSEKSYSPCKLKCPQRITESFRMASMSSTLRFSSFSSIIESEHVI